MLMGEVLAEIFRRRITNKFPVKYAPKNVTKTLERAKKGEIKINPPIPTPEGFRGKVIYHRDKCIGCRLCISVCPAKAIEFKPEEKKIKIYIARCIMCAQCTDICPVGALEMSNEFMLANTKKYTPDMITE